MNIPVIDAHNHVGTGPGCRQTGTDLLAKMDSAGVAKSVIFPFMDSEMNNSAIKEAHNRFPQRFIPFCAVNPWQPTATEDARRCLSEWGFQGLKLHPTVHAFHLTDPKLVNPLFDLAQEFGVPVIVHGAAELYNCPPEFALMAGRYPKVPLLMAHMGFFASVGQAILFAREYPNLYLETSRVPLYEIQSAVRQLGPERVIWGTDSPYADYEWEFHKMKRAGNDAVGYAQIVGGNIARLLATGIRQIHSNSG